jgi:hypothetical protein
VISAFQNLIHWLNYTGLEDLETEDIRKMLGEAVAELQSAQTEEEREAFFVVHSVLTQLDNQQDPLPGLRFMAERYRRVAEMEDEPHGTALERKVRELASQLTGDAWKAGAYRVLEQALLDESTAIDETIDELDRVLSDAWEPYLSTRVTDEEITAETVVGHQVLRDGFSFWFQALDEVELAMTEGRGFDEALALAEEGNRLLVAVQHADVLRISGHG